MENGNTNVKMDGVGYLVVRVSTANGAIPLEGAQVSIRGGQEENKDLFISKVTGASGLTEKIALPAPLKALSETPGNSRPYSLYSIDVFADGYNDIFFVNVPIFDTITSVQPVGMIPKVDNEYPDSFAPYDEQIVEGENTEL